LKTVRVIGVLVAAVQLFSMLAFCASIYTIFMVASSTTSGDAMAVQVTFNEAAGAGMISLDAELRNEGLLGVNLALGIYTLNGSGERIARNSTSVYLEVGGQEPVSLSLQLTEGLIGRLLEGEEGCFEVVMGVRTLRDLVGVSNSMTFGGGGSA
jgi:hypothetical protein